MISEHIKELSLLISDNDNSLLSYWDKNMVCRYANKAFKEWFGLEPEAMIDKITIQELNPSEPFEKKIEPFKLAAKGIKQVYESTILLPNHEIRQVKVSVNPDYQNSELIGYYVHANDISALKKLEQANKEIEKSKRLAQFMGGLNDLVINAQTQDDIFSSFCQIAIDEGKFNFSWVGVLTESGKKLKCIHKAGKDTGYLSLFTVQNKLEYSIDIEPAATTLKSGKYAYYPDLTVDTEKNEWKTEAVKRGYLSAMALPIKVDNHVFAVVVLYAAQTHFFSTEELHLITRVSHNISRALQLFHLEQKRNEIEIQLRKVNQAVEQSSSSIVITDNKGNIEYTNPAFSKLTGYSLNEALGKNPRILKTGHTTTETYIEMYDDLLNHKSWKGEFYNKKKNGETYWESVNISSIVDENGDITNFVAVKENITERKKLEEEQKRLINILENTSAGFATTDSNRNFTWANQALKDLLEVGKEDIRNYNANDFNSETSEKISKSIDKILHANGKWFGENLFISKSGKKIPVLQSLILHKNEKDEIVQVSSALIDLSQVKDAENELQRLNAELRSLAWELQNVREVEKHKLAIEIHDKLGQGLIFLKQEASQFLENIGEEKGLLEKRVFNLVQSINDKVGDFRNIFDTINISMLEELGLFSTIENEIERIENSNSIHIKFVSNTEDEHLSNVISLALFRIVQEALSNIIHHSKAKKCLVRLSKKTSYLYLEIEDNGCGFDTSKINTKFHHGIIAMRERAYAIKANFSLQSSPNNGTSIKVEVPLP